MLRFLPLAFALWAAVAVSANGQDQQTDDHQHQHDVVVQPPASAWSWTTDANVFMGYNYQQRDFADFSAVESQNWFMGDARRSIGRGTLDVSAMLSLEPWTIGQFVFAGDVNPQRVQTGGSPQLFQTGESYHGDPLVNYQHPHDLIMGLGATYRFERGGVGYSLTAALVGAPALGPTPFMHRESARSNPQAPLTHHALDATHITPGVVTGGATVGALSFEASAFRGEEPDDDRTDIERPRLDSWSARVGWRRGPWQAQVSGGHLHIPEWFEPWDVTRLTSSISFDGAVAHRRLAAMVAWGRNIEYNGYDDVADSYLSEWDLRASRMTSLYGRAEKAKKQIFGLGYHPLGLNHRHTYSDIDALTLGVLRDLIADDWGRFGIGADVTVYRTSEDLAIYYGSSRSYHVFLRWRPNREASTHVH
jgi:hypothetical protein